MSDINNLASVNAGSAVNSNLGPNGEPNFDYKTAYEEAQKLIGANSGELGELRTFFGEVKPLLETLDKQDPVLVKALIDGKIDDKLAEAVMAGKVTIQDAETVNNANAAVKKEVGNKEYNNMNPDELEARILAKAKEIANEQIESKISSSINEVERKRGYEEEIENFILHTSDYNKYSDLIDELSEKYPDITSIEQIYLMAKGLTIQQEEEAQKAKDFAEYQKRLASNAGGGYVANGNIPNGDGPSVDDLLGTGAVNTGW